MARLPNKVIRLRARKHRFFNKLLKWSINNPQHALKLPEHIVILTWNEYDKMKKENRKLNAALSEVNYLFELINQSDSELGNLRKLHRDYLKLQNQNFELESDVIDHKQALDSALKVITAYRGVLNGKPKS